MKSNLQLLRENILVILLLLGVLGYSQQGINYQGVARNSEGNLMNTESIDLEINIKKTTSDGTIVYGELHTVATDVNGVFSIIIGQGTPTAIPYDSVNWAEDKHYLNVWLNGTDVGTTQFVEVPYAYAIGKWQAHKNGMTPKGTGGSVYIGENAGENDDFTDNNNVGFGNNALQRVTQGNNNIAIGESALENTTTGHSNIALGFENLKFNTIGVRNIALGHYALKSNTSGSSNIAFGYNTLNKNTTGHTNIAFGPNSLENNTTGGLNIAFGSSTLASNTNGTHNIAMGHLALTNNTSGTHNVGSGYRPLFNNTIGINNIAFGRDVMHSNTMGGNNVALGYNSLYSNTTGGNNLALGASSLYSNTIGKKNIALGVNTLKNNIDGSNNIAIGDNAGINTLGNSNVFIGSYAGLHPDFADVSNTLIIESMPNYGFVGILDKPLIYGEFDNRILGFNAKVGIGTHTPQVPLHITNGTDVGLISGSGVIVVGEESGQNLAIDNNEIQARNNMQSNTLHLQNDGGVLRIGGDTYINGSVYVNDNLIHTSDRRLKREITTISYGLKDVLKLRPTEYFWKGKEQEHKSLGLIAQEVDEVIKNVVSYDKELDKYGVSYTELIPVLIKAIQEQQDIINKQDKIIKNVEFRLQAIEASLLKKIN